MHAIKFTLGQVKKLAVFLIIIPVLFYTHSISFLFFHVSAETFSIVLAISIFLFAWNTRALTQNSFLLFIGWAFLVEALFTFIHSISYAGMNILPITGANIPTQLWIVQRYFLALSFLISPIFLFKKFRPSFIFPLTVIITTLTFLSIFHWQNFPAAYLPQSGLTEFKKLSEFLISAAFLYAIVLFVRYRRHFDKNVFRMIVISLLLNTITELLFAFYRGVYDLVNMTGHIIGTISYYFIYKAVVEIGLRDPYHTLFKELKEAELKKDEFLRFATHELKTPLTSIKLYSQVLSQKRNSYDSDEDIALNLNAVVDKANGLVNELLDMSRLENNRLEINLMEFCIDDLISTTVTEFKNLSDKHEFRIMGATGVRVHGDMQKLGQVITNLISNAVKYSPNGGKITLRVSENMKDITVSVKDNGIGIPKDHQKKVFDKYYRIEEKNQMAQGLGLGLFICKEIVELHHGKMWVNSKEGKGSTFYFSIPK